MQPIILHIDFDSFFASVEQQDNPLLRNRPIGVTATNGRTCIIAASREAKRMGVSSPSRTFEAKQLCPTILFVPAHFVRYWEVSKKFLALCDTFSPTVEVFSLDEVFMDVTYTASLFGGVYPLIKTFKKRLREEVGDCITASVGVSYNKLLAKLASGMKKPDGVMTISSENLWQVYQHVDLMAICGIGKGIKKRLNEMGIFTLVQLRRAPLSSLIAEFGKVEGQILKNIGNGVDETSVIPYTEKEQVKSIGRQYCLPQNEYNSKKVLQNFYELCEEVALKLRKRHKKARTVGFYLGGEQRFFGRKTYTTYINTGKELFDCCFSLLCREARITNNQLHAHNFLGGYIRQISVWVSSLEDNYKIPESLFFTDQKYQKVIKVIDKLNEKFGDHTIRNGFLLYADKLTTVPNGYTANRYE